MHPVRRSVVLILFAAAAGARLPAQSDAAGRFADEVDRYLEEVDEAVAEQRKVHLLASRDATPEAALFAITRPPTKPNRLDPAGSLSLRVPYRGQAIFTHVAAPRLPPSDGKAAPILLDAAFGAAQDALLLPSPWVVTVQGYTPPEFSDESRDGFLKILRSAAHAVGADPDQRWMSGISWGGHACFDVALHRPGELRGILPLIGGPRRVHFRLFPNLAGVVVAALDGEQDDPELVWSLREFRTLGAAAGATVTVDLDPERGHTLPLRGLPKAREAFAVAGPRPAPPARGELLADGPEVALPWLRIETVAKAKVAIPERIPVSARLSADEQRRATIGAMQPKVARLRWTRTDSADATTMTFSSDGVTKATLLIRPGDFPPGRRLVVKVGTRTVFDAIPSPEIATLLSEARRSGERQRPAFRAMTLSF